MNARYLLRLDDACPTMDAHKWGALEALFDEFNIRPLVAVVPDNLDPVLQVDAADPAFWDKVRAWQAKGWTIAMHGYQHVFHPIDRKRLLLPFYDRSEFAGLSYEEQAGKIRDSWRLFKEQGVAPAVWIAPAHCFDHITLQALRDETPIRIISDGIALNQFYSEGFYGIPQQLWGLAAKDTGLWTVCLHPNTMSTADIEGFHDLLAQFFLPRLIAINDVELHCRLKSLQDHFESFRFWQCHRLNRLIQSFAHLING